jgi:hypothetical protein
MSSNVLAKAPPARAWNTRAACFATLLLVFITGAVVGAVAMNLGAHARLHRAPFWTATGKAIYIERVKKDLDLTPAQTEQMESILDDFGKYYRTVLADGKSRIMQMLNEDQRRKFEQMLQEHQKP